MADQGGEKESSSKDQGGSGGNGATGKPGAGEWVIGIICAAIVLAAVGYLFYQGLTRGSGPPVLEARVEQVVPIPNGYVVEVRVVNQGSVTAANVQLEGTLFRDTTQVEKSNAMLHFVPAGTGRRGGLIFTHDPRDYRLEVRVTGFDRP